MSEQATAEHEHGSSDEAEVDQDSHHDLLYVKVAAILAVITGAEIALPYMVDEVEGAVIAVMLVMMVLKFAIVVAYYMHLKFDSLLFRRVFQAGLVLAVGVYVAALSTFQFFG